MSDRDKTVDRPLAFQDSGRRRSYSPFLWGLVLALVAMGLLVSVGWPMETQTDLYLFGAVGVLALFAGIFLVLTVMSEGHLIDAFPGAGMFCFGLIVGLGIPLAILWMIARAEELNAPEPEPEPTFWQKIIGRD